MLNGFLRQSTTSQTRVVGPFIDDTNFKSLEDSLTIANTDVKLSKNGAASVNKSSGGGTHIVNGHYALTFNATDTDTVGELHVSIAVTGALIVLAKFHVLEEVAYDHLFAASAAPAAPAVGAIADAVWNEPQADHVAAGSFGLIATETASILADTGTDGVELSTVALSALADAVWNELRSGHTVVGSFGEAFAPVLSFEVETATAAASPTSFATASITEATADHFIGRTIIWITGSLAGQATDITDYVLTSSQGVFTVTTMTDTPADGDRGLIL